MIRWQSNESRRSSAGHTDRTQTRPRRASSLTSRTDTRCHAQALIEFCKGMRCDLAHEAIEDEDDLEQLLPVRRWLDRGRARQDVRHLTPGRREQDGTPRQGLAAHEHPTRHRRGPRARSPLHRPHHDRTLRPPSPVHAKELLRDQIARADQLYDEGLDGDPTAHPWAARDGPLALRSIARSCARSNELATDAQLGASPCRLGVYVVLSRQAPPLCVTGPL